ncbi:hypothetical protein RhiirC2_793195 [Rhizophagus irregularis]|uniref:F-box domain-containing protein n=1 Tax=Rhizophagus irregularis TaxID=588596 RepID=A0A2N1MFW3_9GLOM|nr:hypothetical protein RhiirC2_793195 [Rhizophagus irregularis]
MLDRLPVEIVKRIVTKIPDTDLIAASKVDNVWWWEVRREAYTVYKRWKNYAITIGNVYWEIQALGKQYEKGDIDWIMFEDVNDSYKRLIDCLTENQLYIMEKMLKNGIVVDKYGPKTKTSQNPLGFGIYRNLVLECAFFSRNSKPKIDLKLPKLLYTKYN